MCRNTKDFLLEELTDYVQEKCKCNKIGPKDETDLIFAARNHFEELTESDEDIDQYAFRRAKETANEKVNEIIASRKNIRFTASVITVGVIIGAAIVAALVIWAT
ncbi:MAG: hypothetical protein WCP11_03540 [Candidatus Saccharibacteria bacterium]